MSSTDWVTEHVGPGENASRETQQQEGLEEEGGYEETANAPPRPSMLRVGEGYRVTLGSDCQRGSGEVLRHKRYTEYAPRR